MNHSSTVTTVFTLLTPSLLNVKLLLCLITLKYVCCSQGGSVRRSRNYNYSLCGVFYGLLAAPVFSSGSDDGFFSLSDAAADCVFNSGADMKTAGE